MLTRDLNVSADDALCIVSCNRVYFVTRLNYCGFLTLVKLTFTFTQRLAKFLFFVAVLG